MSNTKIRPGIKILSKPTMRHAARTYSASQLKMVLRTEMEMILSIWSFLSPFLSLYITSHNYSHCQILKFLQTAFLQHYHQALTWLKSFLLIKLKLLLLMLFCTYSYIKLHFGRNLTRLLWLLKISLCLKTIIYVQKVFHCMVCLHYSAN